MFDIYAPKRPRRKLIEIRVGPIAQIIGKARI